MMTEGTTLELMERTLKIIVSGSRQNIQQYTRRNIIDLVKEEGAEAVWQMERGDQWFVTFKDSTIVDCWDGKSLKPPNVNVTLNMYACDRLIVRCRVLWLPIWVTNEDIYRVLNKYGDIKDVRHNIDADGIGTGVREVVFSMREGDQNHLPYLTSVHGHRCLLSVPGRPPICFKCEGVGHLRHQCPHGDRPRLRSYASAVQGPVVGKRGEESVGKTPQQAVSKPTGEEPSGSPSNQGDSSGPQEGLVAIQTGPHQDNQEDHGSPNEGLEPAGSTPDGKGLESPDTEGDTEVSTQWADTEVSPMDIGSLHLDDEGFVEVRHKKARRAEPDPPISPLAAQPSRADR